MALIEAMAYGVPVIATRTGGMPELLEGGAGVLVPPADSDALADALERVLGSPELRAELGARRPTARRGGVRRRRRSPASWYAAFAARPRDGA